MDSAFDGKGRIGKKFIDTDATHQEYSYTWKDTGGAHQKLTLNGTLYESDVAVDELGRITTETVHLTNGTVQRNRLCSRRPDS